MPSALAGLVLLRLLTGVSPAQEARAQLSLAGEDYQSGRYDQAAHEYLAADRAQPKSAYLLKAAKCFERAGELAEAVEQYQAYLRRVPFASNRNAIRKTVARLKRRLASGSGALAAAPLGGGGLTPAPLSPAPLEPAPLAPAPLEPTPLAPAPLEPTPLAPAAPHEVTANAPEQPPGEATHAPEATAEAAAPKPIKPILMTTGGAVAIALAAVSAYWGGWGLDALSISQHNQNQASPAVAHVYDKEISTYETQAGVWLTVAGMLTAGGVYLLVTGPSSGSAPSTAVSAAPVPGGAAVSFSGSFR